MGSAWARPVLGCLLSRQSFTDNEQLTAAADRRRGEGGGRVRACEIEVWCAGWPAYSCCEPSQLGQALTTTLHTAAVYTYCRRARLYSLTLTPGRKRLLLNVFVSSRTEKDRLTDETNERMSVVCRACKAACLNHTTNERASCGRSCTQSGLSASLALASD